MRCLSRSAANHRRPHRSLFWRLAQFSTPRQLTARLRSATFSPVAIRTILLKKAAVLRFVNSHTYATLAPQASTKATRLDGQQEIYFIESGHGTATAAGQTVDLYRNIAVLMPANLEFTIKNTGDEPLTMYVINEPTPPGFRPNANMLVRGREQASYHFERRSLGAHRKDILRDSGRPGHAAERSDSDARSAYHGSTARRGSRRHRRSLDRTGRHQPGVREQSIAAGKLPEWRFTTFPTTKLRTPTSTRTKTRRLNFCISLVTIRTNLVRRPASPDTRRPLSCHATTLAFLTASATGPCAAVARHGANRSAFQRHEERDQRNQFVSRTGVRQVCEGKRSARPAHRSCLSATGKDRCRASSMAHWCLRDILMRGDNFAPSQKGAVLRAANFLAYGRLAPWRLDDPVEARRVSRKFIMFSAVRAKSPLAAIRRSCTKMSLS